MSRGKESSEVDPPQTQTQTDADPVDPVAATRVMAELAKKMQLAPTFEEKKQGRVLKSKIFLKLCAFLSTP